MGRWRRGGCDYAGRRLWRLLGGSWKTKSPVEMGLSEGATPGDVMSILRQNYTSWRS